MFLSTDVAVALINNPTVVPALITKAFKVTLPWTTTRCTVHVKRLTGAAMLATTDEYNAAFLYSIALGCEVDPGGLFSLSDRQAEVSFKLFKTWREAAARDVPRDAAAGGPGLQTATLDSEMAGAGEGENSSEEGSEPDKRQRAPSHGKSTANPCW